ncbi:hypothetical protein QBC38DRAFT_357581, partial [Podospora fimiseda]
MGSDDISLGSIGIKILDTFQVLNTAQQDGITPHFQRFRLWAHGLGLFQHGHASLDYRVRDAEVVKARLAEMLNTLQEHLENTLSIVRGDRPPFEEQVNERGDDDGSLSDTSTSSVASTTSSSSNSSIEPVYELEFRQRAIINTIDALYTLAAKIRNNRNRTQKTMNELLRRLPSHEREEHIRHREQVEIAIVAYLQRQDLLRHLHQFDLKSSGLTYDSMVEKYASESNFLVKRTGIANARRKQQFIYWKEHAKRIARVTIPKPVQRPSEDLATKIPQAAPDQLQVMPQELLGASSHDVSAPSLPEHSLATSATRLDDSLVRFDDTQSTVSFRSQVSAATTAQGNKIYWPPPPLELEDNGFFICPYCKTICSRKYLASDTWCSHLMHDLEPYHCTYQDCQEPNRLYGSYHDWRDHESTHVRVWHCYFHDFEFDTQQEYIHHMEQQHPDSKSEHLSPELMAAAFRPSHRPLRDCPLCPTRFSTLQEMHDHIKHHLERLARCCLPTDPSDDHEDQISGHSLDS